MLFQLIVLKDSCLYLKREIDIEISIMLDWDVTAAPSQHEWIGQLHTIEVIEG